MIARSVLGLLPRGAHVSGTATLEDTPVLGASEQQLNQVRGTRAAMVCQEPRTALNPVRTIGWQLAEALRAHRRISRADARSRAIELLELVGIPEPARRVRYYPHQLSGGQQQRVVIALALSGEPSLLIADEPTTALDVTVQAEILALLRELRDRTGAAILLITHNLGVVADLADRVVVLRGGRVIEQRQVNQLFAHPVTDYTRQLLAAVPTLPDAARTESRPPPPAAPAPKAGAVLELNHISVMYPGHLGRSPLRALHDVSLQVGPGEVVGLVGESGSGKTTLGRVAVGLVRATIGQVLLQGHDVSRLRGADERTARRGLAMVHQDPAASLDPRFTVADSIAEPLRVHGAATGTALRTRVAQCWRRCGCRPTTPPVGPPNCPVDSVNGWHWRAPLPSHPGC